MSKGGTSFYGVTPYKHIVPSHYKDIFLSVPFFTKINTLYSFIDIRFRGASPFSYILVDDALYSSDSFNISRVTSYLDNIHDMRRIRR